LSNAVDLSKVDACVDIVEQFRCRNDFFKGRDARPLSKACYTSMKVSRTFFHSRQSIC
jgi:hypothetical protein